jgi:hypothetical protein
MSNIHADDVDGAENNVVKAFKCPHCTYSATRRNYILRHMREFHAMSKRRLDVQEEEIDSSDGDEE